MIIVTLTYKAHHIYPQRKAAPLDINKKQMKILNKQFKVVLSITAIMLFVTTLNLKAQTYKIVTGKDVTIKVLGSSNVHDWVEASSTIESQGEFKVADDSQIQGLTTFTLSVAAKSLKSEHEMMDTRTYKAIKADQFPKITFKLESAVVTPIQKGKATIKATGDLTIAGVTQSIVLEVSAVVNADNTITCNGSKKIKLTDFKIDPPSYLLGAMKVTNDLNIQFNLTYKK